MFAGYFATGSRVSAGPTSGACAGCGAVCAKRMARVWLESLLEEGLATG